MSKQIDFKVFFNLGEKKTTSETVDISVIAQITKLC